MSSVGSRRDFLIYLPGCTLVLLASSRRVAAISASRQNPPINQGNPGQAPPVHPSPNNNGSGGSVGPGPGPAQHGGDYQPINIAPRDSKNKNPAPRKPRKDLEADQKLLRDQVRQLVLDSHDLKRAMDSAQVQTLTAAMIDKTKEIEKLAHNIAVLAKG